MAGTPKKKKAPKCPSLTIAGNPCKNACPVVTMRGKKYRLKTCMMHSSDAIRKECGCYREPGTAIPNAGRKKALSASDILRERFEAEADRYLQPLEDALTAMKAMVVGNGGSAHLEYTEDISLRIQAVEKILDRIYGRPRQAIEHTGHNGDAIEVSVPSDEERQKAVAAVLASTGALQIPTNASAAAPSTN